MSVIERHPVTNKPLKVTVVGDLAVGKTCLLKSHSTETFPIEYERNYDNYNHVQMVEDEAYRLTSYDISAQEDCERLRRLSYLGTSVFIICFSLNSMDSFQSVSAYWLPEIRYNFGTKMPILLVGTKMDIRDDKAIGLEEITKLVKMGGFFQYLECSAKTGEGVNEVYNAAVKAYLEMLKRKKTKLCTLL